MFFLKFKISLQFFMILIINSFNIKESHGFTVPDLIRKYSRYYDNGSTHFKLNSRIKVLRSHNSNGSSINVSASAQTISNNSINNNNSKVNYPSWLEQATEEILDKSRIPLGQLTSDDVESISGLMANWAKRKSTQSAIQVETLLKRVVDDHNYGNSSVKVTTRMYTMAIDAWAKTGGREAAERASAIHRHMVEQYKNTCDINIKPSTISYNAVINAWSKSGLHDMEEAALRAEGILNEMLEEWRRERQDTNDQNQSTEPGFIGPDTKLGADFYDDDEYYGDDKKGAVIKPDVVSFTSVIDTWAKSGKKNGAAKAMNLLKQMEKLYVEEGQQGMKPNVYTYSACINAFAKSADPEAPKEAEALLLDMKKAYEAGDMDVKPNVVNYNSVINAWGRCRAPGSAERASQILYSMENEGVEPDALSYSLVVSAWAHSSNSNATKQAEVVLGEMEDWAREKNKAIDDAFDHRLSTQDQCYSYDGDGPVVNPPSSLPAIRVHLDVECYNTVLIALSRRQEPGAPDRALAILHRMQKLADNEGFETVRPNAKSWNSVLNAMSREKNADATRRAEQLLNDMKEAGVRPDVFSYAALLHAYQKNASSYSAQRADKIVRTMEQLYQDGELAQAPDVYHYTIVCACWARSGDSIAARRCYEILQHMEKRVQLGFSSCRPNVRTMNAVIDAYARGHHVDEAEQLLDDMISRYRAGDKNVKPDGFTFNAVINCWTRSRRRGCGYKAEMILKRLLKFHEEGNPDVRPDSRSFSHIIDYYSRSREPDAGKKATFLLEGMIKMYDNGYTEVLPTIFTFAAVISAHSKTKDRNAGIHAEHVLQMLKDMNRKHSKLALKTNTFIMNTVLHAWSKSGHPSACYRVEEYLKEMERKHKSGDMNLKPNTRTYGLVLATWAKSTVPDKTKRAFQVFEQMRLESKTNANVEMNIHCYNAVINAAAFTEGDYEHRNESFQIATKIMDELISPDGIQPISSTFGTYLKACGKLSLPRNIVEPAIRRAFTKCIEYGLVNDFVLTQVRYSASTEQYESLLGDLITEGKIDERIKMSDIPEEWHKNVSDSYNSFDDDFRGELWRDNS